MTRIKVQFDDKELAVIKQYAAIDDRSMSSFIRHAVMGHIRRNRKKDRNGNIIEPPQKVEK